MTPLDRSKMTIMITGAGLSTRMRPLTDNIHKIMLPIAPGLPMLEHTLNLMKQQGFKNFVVNTHYLPHTITDYFGDGKKFGLNIAYSHESGEPLEVGGGLKKAAHLLSDPFMLIYGDHLHFLDFDPFFELYEKSGGAGVIALSDQGNPLEGEVAEFNKDSYRIIRWYTRPHNIKKVSDTHLRNAGFYILSKSILDHIPANKKVSLDKEIMSGIIESGVPLYGLKIEDPFIDIGTPERYEYAKKWYQEQLGKE